MTIGMDGEKSRTDANGHRANHSATSTSRSIRSPMSAAKRPSDIGMSVARRAKSIPAPVSSPLKGTIRRLARMPTGEIRWKVEARIGAVPRKAATDKTQGSRPSPGGRTAGSGTRLDCHQDGPGGDEGKLKPDIEQEQRLPEEKPEGGEGEGVQRIGLPVKYQRQQVHVSHDRRPEPPMGSRPPGPHKR